MFGSAPRFPFRGLLLIGLGFLLASMLGGAAGTAGSIAAAILFIPLLILKVLFFLFLFSLFFRMAGAFAGGGRGPGGDRGPWGPGRPHGPGGRRTHHGRRTTADPGHWSYKGRPMTDPTPPAPSQEDAEWEESLRQARREVDDIDAPFRAPRPGGQPPADADVDPEADGPRD